MSLDRAAIEKRLPHAGAMSLLDSVMQWDLAQISCSAAAPSGAHPLARDGRVPAIAAAEYAAQAAAVHGALLEDGPARSGMLATLRDVDLHADCIPFDGGPLAVRARLLSRGALGCLYAFEVEAPRQRIASGRLMVAFASTSRT